MRCGRCGNENAETNRFCGMCGAALVANQPAAQAPLSGPIGPRATAAERRPPSSSTNAATHPEPRTEPRTELRTEPRTEPTITGPSFLGLNTPAAGTSSRGGAPSDRHADGAHDVLRPSSNVDYLLEDDDEPPRGWGKLILFVVALALAVGFGYLHWKRGGFDWLNVADKKPAVATTQAPNAGQNGADSGGAATAPQPAASATPQASSGTAPVAGGSANPAESGAPPSIAPQTTPQAPTSQSASPTPPSQSTPPANTPAQTAPPQSAEQPSAPPSNAGDSSAAASGSQAADSDTDHPGSDQQAPAAEAPPRRVVRKPAPTKPAAAKPTPVKPSAAKAVDSVSEAERYIYGRGVGQDCDRGLRLLKPAAEQSNVRAMVSMGVLYSTGTCTPRDLPTAYRWFATALHKEPDNQALQDDLQSLWGKMTPPERQLAIKLSQ